MRKIGTVLHLASSGRLILQGNNVYPLNTSVVTQNGEFIGKIIDVFGDVNKPYIAVSKDKLRDSSDLIGVSLFIRENTRKRHKSKRTFAR